MSVVIKSLKLHADQFILLEVNVLLQSSVQQILIFLDIV